MAANDGKSLERLYIELGLDLSQLQADFLAADKSVTENIGRLNRQNNTIKLRMEADIASLDRVRDATQILAVQEQSLNQQLTLSRDKLAILEAAYKQVASNQNSSAMAVQRAEQAYQKARLEVGKLEQALKNLSAQKISLDTSHLQDNISKLNARIQHVRITADIDTSKLQGANAAFDAQKIHIAAVTKEIELQRQKLAQLQAQMYQSARGSGSDSVQTLNIKSNVLQQIQQINQLETKLKDLKATNINLQIRADSLRQAEQSITDNIARINARIEHIRVKTDIDVSKLGAAATEFDKAKAHVAGLNRELTLQNQKLAELRRSLATSVSTNGLNNVKTINLQTDIQKQIQAINQLKAKIDELNKIPPPKTNNLLSGYLNVKGNVAGALNDISMAFSSLQGATSSADSAITASLSVIGSIPHPVGRAVAAFAAMPVVLRGVENSFIDMTRAAAAAGDSTYVMSRGFQMSVADTGKFITFCKTAGVEVNDLASTIRRLQQSVIRGGDDAKPEQWLRRYGESVFDATGHLKDFNEQTLSLNRALKRAQAEGNSMAFILATMRNASADAITAIEDAEDVYKQAATTVKNGLLDPKFAHQVQGNINQMNDQAAKMNATFSASLLPVANEIVPRLIDRMGKLTQIIADNKDMIREFGRTAADAFLKVEDFAEGVGKSVFSVGKFFYDLQKNPRQDAIVEKYKNDLSIETVDDLIKAEQPKAYDVIKANPFLYNQTLAIYNPMFRALHDVQDEVRRKNEELEKLLKQPLSAADASAIGQERRDFERKPELLDSLRQARKYQEAADAILYKMNHGDYENKKLDVDIWWNELVRETEKSSAELEALANLRSAKLEQIEQERADKLKEIRDSVAAADKTALENKIDAIEKERQAWIKAGMDEAEATELAQKKLSDYIKNTQEELSTKIQSLYQTELERRLAQIEQEKQAWIDKCGDEVKATKLAEQQKADAQRAAAMQVIRQQAKEFEAFQQGGFAGLQAYKLAQLAKSGVNLNYLNMTPQQLQLFQRANQIAEKSLLPNFMTNEDRTMYRAQQAADRDRTRIFDEKNYAIVDGIRMGLSDAIGGQPIKISLGDGSELSMLAGSNRAVVTDYTTDKNGRITQRTERDLQFPNFIMSDTFDNANYAISDGVKTLLSEALNEMPTAVQGVTTALNELPTAILGVTENFSIPIMPPFEQLNNSFANMDSDLQVTIQRFNEINSGVEEVTIRLSDLSSALQNFYLPKENSSTREQRTPVNVSVTVQIDEAHAWDSQHIQELVDKVADKIQPEIISAIGGDGNSY